jgi:cytochrome c553
MPLFRHRVTAALVGLAAIATTTAAGAADIANGRKLAAAKCQLCHGMDGLSKMPLAPNLAGQLESYLLAQMQAFHDGQRKNEMMSLIAPSLSPADEADLAAYYATIEVTIGKIPGE